MELFARPIRRRARRGTSGASADNLCDKIINRHCGHPRQKYLQNSIFRSVCPLCDVAKQHIVTPFLTDGREHKMPLLRVVTTHSRGKNVRAYPVFEEPPKNASLMEAMSFSAVLSPYISFLIVAPIAPNI
ncbi:hypothetical protein [Candidatus Bathycorpusculum sp.]|uniref:hypothetical protein n=1 Tax=Candidatus Bathycorpusculum sp. TaxID=2994959 RepID=UPI002834C9EA|nr:hypothetical protein [Candidatus Termitimicrobium sp.]